MSEFKHTTLSLNLKKHKNGAGGVAETYRAYPWLGAFERKDR